MFTNAKSVKLNEKVVKSIITKDGGVLYQKDNPLTFDITISDVKNLYITSMFRGANMTIDYGDGIIRPMTDDAISWKYQESGTYTIKIYGVETIFIDLENIPIISNVSIPDYVTVAPPLFTYNDTQYAGWWSSSKNIVIDNLPEGTKISHTPAELKYWTPNKPNTSLPLPKLHFNLLVDWNDFICSFTYIEFEGDNTIEIRDINGNRIAIPVNELNVSQGDVIKIVYTNNILTLYINDVPQGFNNISDTSACSGDVNIRFGINAGYIIYKDFIIQDISPELVLETNKSILSYHDNDTTTLTATLTQNGVPFEGETVLIYDSDNVKHNDPVIILSNKEYESVSLLCRGEGEITFTGCDKLWIYNGNNLISSSNYSSSLTFKITVSNNVIKITEPGYSGIIWSYNLTESEVTLVFNIGVNIIDDSWKHFYHIGTTDSNGECSVVYNSKGAGDLTIKAEVPERMLVSEIYVEDCLVYDPLTSNSGKWTIPSGVTSQYSSNGWRISANAYKQIKLTDKLTNPCSVTFTIVDYSTPSSSYPPVIIYQYTNGDTTPNQVLLLVESNSSMNVLGTTVSHTPIKGGVYRIEYDSTMKMYENNALLATASNSVGLPTRFEFHQGRGSSRYAVYKDLKVKPL